MLLNDKQITAFALGLGMIKPFAPKHIRKTDEGHPVISYGLGSYGYDIRLSPKEFAIFRHQPGRIVDPKDFQPDSLETVELQEDSNGKYFIIPGNSYGLGVALECLDIPSNITVLCIGKSTYARAGIIANVTPGEAGWKGHLTLEFSNSSPADCKIYANEGVIQLLFLVGKPCETTYDSRESGGKYQNQTENITHSRV